MAELNSETKAQLAVTAVDIILTKGLPALATLVNELNNKDVVTIEDIESVKGELDSEKYFN